MQHGLAGDAHALGRFLHHDVALGYLLHETALERVVDAYAPWCAGGELLAGDEAVVEPAVDGRRGQAEFAGGLAHAHQFAAERLGGDSAPGYVPVAAQIANEAMG